MKTLNLILILICMAFVEESMAMRPRGGATANPAFLLEGKKCGGRKVEELRCSFAVQNDQWMLRGKCQETKTGYTAPSGGVGGVMAGKIGIIAELHSNDKSVQGKTEYCMTYQINIESRVYFKPSTKKNMIVFPNPNFPLNLKVRIIGIEDASKPDGPKEYNRISFGEHLLKIHFDPTKDMELFKAGGVSKLGNEIFSFPKSDKNIVDQELEFEVVSVGTPLIELEFTPLRPSKK